jgi:GAF domain-containing protein
MGAADALAERLEPLCLDLLEFSLEDDGGVLPIVPSVDGYEGPRWSLAKRHPGLQERRSDKDLWVTSEANIGSYVAVPVVLSDGRPYGMLCCVSHRADPRLRERDLGLMEGVAREVSRHLKREGLRV